MGLWGPMGQASWGIILWYFEEDMPLWESLKFLKKTCTEDPPLVVLCYAGVPIAEGVVFWFHLSWEFWFGFSLYEWPVNYLHDSVHTGQALWGELFRWFVIGVSVLFCAPSLGSEREVDHTHSGFVMASLSCSEHTSFLLFESQGHCSLGAWRILYSLCPYGCQYLLFVLCILSCYLWSSSQLLSSRTANLQPYQTAPGVTDLTGNLSYSRVRTCDGSSMELRCLLFIAVAFAFVFLKNFNKPLTFLLMWVPPNPRFHPFNVYWRDLRRTVVFHSSRKSCTLLWSWLAFYEVDWTLNLPRGFGVGYWYRRWETMQLWESLPVQTPWLGERIFFLFLELLCLKPVVYLCFCPRVCVLLLLFVLFSFKDADIKRGLGGMHNLMSEVFSFHV